MSAGLAAVGSGVPLPWFWSVRGPESGPGCPIRLWPGPDHPHLVDHSDSSSPTERLNAALEGRYVIEREGGMATVYLANDLKHERKVALKVLKPKLAVVV